MATRWPHKIRAPMHACMRLLLNEEKWGNARGPADEGGEGMDGGTGECARVRYSLLSPLLPG